MSQRHDAVFITGASSGIGRATAIALAERHPLILAGRDQGRLERVRSECRRASEHRLCIVDLAEPATILDALSPLLRETSIAHLVHSAGVFSVGPIRNVDWEDALRMFNVNLFSAIELARQLSRKKINVEGLRTVTFLSSIASRIGVPGYHLYSATKGALNALARSLAVELAPSTRVNCVLPGSIETDGTRSLFADPEARARIDGQTPLGAGSPDDVAAVIRFLLSDDARWVTGQEFVVDGGRSIT